MGTFKKAAATFHFIIHHPFSKRHRVKGISRLIYWQARSLFTAEPMPASFTKNTRILLNKGLRGATGNYYCGLHEFNEMCFVLHCLRPEDLFVDVGANIGSYTILAGGGAGSKTIAFEPVPSTFEWLEKNITLNEIESRTMPIQTAVSDFEGEIFFTANRGAMNHILPGYENDSIKVPVNSLDNLLENESCNIIKIDVEGFEAKVLNGFKTGIKNPGLKAIIIEMGDGLMPGTQISAHDFICDNAFTPFEYSPFERVLKKIDHHSQQNTIYIRDVEWATDRIMTSRPIEIWGEKI